MNIDAIINNIRAVAPEGVPEDKIETFARGIAEKLDEEGWLRDTPLSVNEWTEIQRLRKINQKLVSSHNDLLSTITHLEALQRDRAEPQSALESDAAKDAKWFAAYFEGVRDATAGITKRLEDALPSIQLSSDTVIISLDRPLLVKVPKR